MKRFAEKKALGVVKGGKRSMDDQEGKGLS